MGALSPAQGEYHQRRLNHAHKRYLAAIRSLAVVRRLLRPVAAKVNIGAQQVNVVASAEGDSRPDS